jgi:hypothetical protein
MRIHSWLALGLILAFGHLGEAQPVPRTISCNDASGRAVDAVQVTNGIIAKATVRDGRATIEYDARKIDGVTSQLQLFVYAHECGHHALGHDVRGPAFSVAQEQEADCQAIRSLMAKVGFTSNDVRLLENDMRDLGSESARNLPWRARPYDLEGCLPEVISRRQAAARREETTADECVVHNDGENAIVTKSRDGRIIDGVYSARNRCPRDLSCTFTVEVGTLPDSAADLGSWRGFRVQHTITEQRGLSSMSANLEFRFHGTVDTVPAGESVDFRVLPACQFAGR